MIYRTIVVKTAEDFTSLVENSDWRIVQAIVEGALKNLHTERRFIHILTVEVEEDDDIYDLTLDRKEFRGALERNLKHYEKMELYERCQDIVDAIKLLEEKENNNGQENINTKGNKKKKKEGNTCKNKDK